MTQRDHYTTQSELPPHQSPFPIPVPAPRSPTTSLLARLSSPAPSDTSSSLTTVDPEYGLDEDAVDANRSFVIQLGNNHPVISVPTRLLNVPISCRPASALTKCFGALAQVTIVRTAPSTSVPTATSLPPDTLRLLVCPPNATYVADGDIATNSVPLEFVTYAIEEVTSLTIVCLIFFPLSRLPISLGIPLTRDRLLPHGVLIEPGVQLYEGGNVTVCLLTYGIFLLSFL